MAEDEAIAEVRDGFNRLRGRLFGALEASMPEKQEQAIRRLIRQLSYYAQADVESALRRRD